MEGWISNSIRRSAEFHRSRTFSGSSLLMVSGGMADASIALAVTDIQLLAPKSSVLSSPSSSMKWKYQHFPCAVFNGFEPAECASPPDLVSWVGSPGSLNWQGGAMGPQEED